MDIIKYKEYEGTAELDMERCICRGKILFINDLIIYEAIAPKDLQKAFEAAVDDYLETCAELAREPQRPLKGLFNVRVSPELHKKCILRAQVDGTSLNEVVGKALDAYVNITDEVNHNYNFTFVAPEKDLIKTGISSAAMKPEYWGGTVRAAH